MYNFEKNVILDFREVRYYQEIHRIIKKALDFPEWYGGNLDALYDCMTDLMEELDVEFLNWDRMEENLGDYAGKVLRVLRDAAEVNLNILLIGAPEL